MCALLVVFIVSFVAIVVGDMRDAAAVARSKKRERERKELEDKWWANLEAGRAPQDWEEQSYHQEWKDFVAWGLTKEAAYMEAVYPQLVALVRREQAARTSEKPAE
jgi:hypothetical protein